VITDLDPKVRSLFELGQKRTWLAYEELNDIIPDELVDTIRIDELLVALDDLDIEMVHLLEYKARRWREARKRGENGDGGPSHR
jgi:hypothetical protein